MTEQEQIDALKAQVNCLREALTNAAKSPNYAFHYAKEALEATPAQCLAEVKAKAIEDMQSMITTYTTIYNNDHYHYRKVDVIQYVNQLREQAK